MKTFEDYLPTITAREREIVEAYVAHEDHRLCDKYGYQMQGGLKLMRSTPPAKEPVSVEGTCAGYGLPGANGMLSVVRVLVDVLQDEGEKAGIKRGDRVRVVKIEEVQQ